MDKLRNMANTLLFEFSFLVQIILMKDIESNIIMGPCRYVNASIETNPFLIPWLLYIWSFLHTPIPLNILTTNTDFAEYIKTLTL